MVRAELDAFNQWWSARPRTLVRQAGIAAPRAAVDLIDVMVDGLVLSGFDEGTPWPAARRRRVLAGLWRSLGIGAG
ncbi:hypothetical protein [Nocardia sp. CC227C]|uniref:hypothetical protein n=1 Tax=Nocardia sp. CC227C TaxID=3044562 RepID=UPI00278C79CA|nr:hypothetical protein [Nocardia sp. CC227C]